MGKQIANNTEKRKYFSKIARRRFSSIKQDIDLVSVLGDQENLDDECHQLCKGRKDHLINILKERPKIVGDVELCEKVISIIKNDDNPIAESINALWVIRSADSPIVAAEVAQKAMTDYFDKVETEHSKKFRNDYTNKYRYAITVLISSVYRKSKMYYGFNTICYLADSNTRTFINICRAIFSDALFYERSSFIATHTVSMETQNKAIHEFASTEFDNICSIIDFGNSIRNFILNLGNVFAEYHKDYRVRYPETNQFVFNKLELSEPEKSIISTAESWSIIVKRDRPQRVSAGIGRKGDIYYICRVFAPIFNISYRIRGGVNVQFTTDEIKQMTVSLNTRKKLSSQKKLLNSISDDKELSQLTFFCEEDDCE